MIRIFRQFLIVPLLTQIIKKYFPLNKVLNVPITFSFANNSSGSPIVDISQNGSTENDENFYLISRFLPIFKGTKGFII